MDSIVSAVDTITLKIYLSDQHQIYVIHFFNVISNKNIILAMQILSIGKVLYFVKIWKKNRL